MTTYIRLASIKLRFGCSPFGCGEKFAHTRLKFRQSVREYGGTANRRGITLWEIYMRTKSHIYVQEREIAGERD